MNVNQKEQVIKENKSQQALNKKKLCLGEDFRESNALMKATR